MKKFLTFALFFGFLNAGAISVKDAYVKQTMGGMKNTAIFMQINNDSDKDVKLIDAKEHTLGGVTELHTHLHENGMMKMVKVPNIEIKAHSSTLLKPKSYHVMVIGIEKPVLEDTKAKLTLYFDNGEEITLKDISSKALKMNHNHNNNHEHNHAH